MKYFGIIAALTVFFFLLPETFSQKDTLTLPPAQITGEKIKTDSSGWIILKIITAEEIKNSPVHTINDLLDYVHGIDLRERGNMGVQADLSIRGGTFEQSLVFLNGVCMNNAQTGHHTLDLPLDISDIERIEVLKGRSARINGANAFAGAINIITRTGDDIVRLSVAGGEYGWYAGSAAAFFTTAKTAHLISLGKMSSDGYQKNTDFDYDRIYWQSNIVLKRFKAGIDAGFGNRRFGANSFYTAKYPDQFEQTRSLFVNGDMSYTSGNISISLNPYFRRHQDRFELFRYEAPVWYAGHNYHLTNTGGVKAKAGYSAKYGQSIIGFDFRNEVINSNVLGEPSGDTINVPFESKGFFTKHKERNILELFADHSIPINNKLSLSAGLMSHYSENAGWLLCPGADAIYNANKNLSFSFSYSSAVRNPTFTDLYYKGPVNIGNAKLKPEQSEVYELAGQWSKGKSINIGGALFLRQAKNLIDWVRTSDTLPWRSSNITGMNTLGGELTLFISPSIFNKENDKPFFKGLWMDFSYVTADKSSGDWISYYVLDYLKYKAGGRLEHRVYGNLTVSWRLNYQDRAGNYNDFLTGTETDYKAFMVFSSRIIYQQSFFKSYIDIANITNEKYIDFGNIYQPGRWIKAGAVFSFNIKKIKNIAE